MSDDKNWESILQLREKFRQTRPDLKLPPAKQMSPEERLKYDEEQMRREMVRLKHESIQDTARQNPTTIARLIKRFTDNK